MFPENYIVVFFDGHCHLCSRTVRFLLWADRKEQLFFAPLNNPLGKQARQFYAIPEEMDSVIVVAHGKAMTEAEAIFFLMKTLGGWLRIFLILKVLPISFLNRVYRLVARNRFRLFGRRKTCFLPRPGREERFL